MKNILLITSLYPSDDIKILNNTSVCHYFAKEWMALGYNVRVMFCYHCYPAVFYPILKLMSKILADKAGIAVMTENSTHTCNYELDGIKVSRIPIRKNRPGGTSPPKETVRVAKEIEDRVKNENFVPDIILGHFLHPAIDIITLLKNKYPSAQTAVSIHGKEEVFEERTKIMVDEIDLLGYRSYPIQRVFESFYGNHPFFMCPSGVPQDYIIPSERIFREPAKSFIYVGSFMERKYPSLLIPAISSAYGDEEYSVTFVGDGNGKELIDKEIEKANAVNKVIFTGRLKRDDVRQHLDRADVFIMISRLETFGLVYLEAMARGCIVVASKDEGMEGIIQNGVNGFLCEAGNASELSDVVKTIKSLSLEELNSISEAGRQTALMMTDKKVAKDYINNFE